MLEPQIGRTAGEIQHGEYHEAPLTQSHQEG